MKNKDLELKSKLEKSLKQFSNVEKYKVGRLNDEMLRETIFKLRKNPSLDNFIRFVSCLNYFYSTRLQAAQGDRNEIIIKVAKFLMQNWNDNIVLRLEKEGKKCAVKKVDALKEGIHHLLNRRAYSFSTKVFHQLNNSYPILDSNVSQFMKIKEFNNRTNFYNHSYSLFYEAYDDMGKTIGWTKGVDKLDIAIWILVSNEEDIYFSTRYLNKLKKIEEQQQKIEAELQ